MSNQALNQNFFENLDSHQEILLATLRTSCKKIAPLWPLENFVAVNSFLGHTHKKFDQTAYELAAAGGIQMTLPPSFYLNKLKEGKIKNKDLATVLSKRNHKADVNIFLDSLTCQNDEIETLATIACVTDMASQDTGKDWSRFVTTRISVWAASYFDKGQAIWSTANQNESLFLNWKTETEIDRTAELSGLNGFRKLVKEIPNHPLKAIQVCLEKLGVPSQGIDLYLHRILLRVGGWSAYAAQLDWQSELNGGSDGKLIEFLAVLICWEACLLESLNNEKLKQKWNEAKEVWSLPQVQTTLNKQLEEKLILQEAFDLSAQRNLAYKFEVKPAVENASKQRPRAQAIFCIDVRSEVYRRNLEQADDTIETLGFAGFFAFPIKYVPIGHQGGEANCPVLLPTGPTIMEQMPDSDQQQKALSGRIFNRQMQQVWKSFKSGAVTCFSFVSPMGLSYLPKLFTDSFGITRPVADPNRVGMSDSVMRNKSISLATGSFKSETTGIPVKEQISMAKNALKAMSLADDFAKFVMIVGHGSTTVNNPHATGYDCGACGGHTGEANARVVATVLNNPEVREGLKKENIQIPSDTIFLACLHDTTTDDVQIYNEHEVPLEKANELKDLKNSLSLAGQKTRAERALRLSTQGKSNIDKVILMKSKDWSETRPEWGLAGCSSFVVAPRSRTKGIDFEGKSFLHSYDWKKDRGFSVLELIMTAPMVVTSWINLQYYGSTVDNKNFGSGNKTLHNVTAGLGVIEGYSGDLRVGLPMQSIHDGANYQHEPLKLSVIIEAPVEAMNMILEKHPSVKDLCDNGWLQLMALDDDGKVSHRYTQDLRWERLREMAA